MFLHQPQVPGLTVVHCELQLIGIVAFNLLHSHKLKLILLGTNPLEEIASAYEGLSGVFFFPFDRTRLTSMMHS
jgi:hypothetical protein